jgi:hypothetical protein
VADGRSWISISLPVSVSRLISASWIIRRWSASDIDEEHGNPSYKHADGSRRQSAVIVIDARGARLPPASSSPIAAGTGLAFHVLRSGMTLDLARP